MLGEGMSAGDQLVGDDAPGVDIGALIGGRIRRRLLGRHVHRRANGVARLGDFGPGFLARCLHGFGDPEIGDDGGAFAEENVLGLDVAVDDPLPVGVGERGGDVAENGEALLDRNWTFANPLAQRFPAHERHGEVRISADGLARGEHGYDVRLLEPRREPDLALEPRRREGVGELGRQNLDDDVAPERLVAGDEDPRHSAGAELPLHGVAASERLLQLFQERIHGPRRTVRVASSGSNSTKAGSCKLNSSYANSFFAAEGVPLIFAGPRRRDAMRPEKLWAKLL